MATDYPCANCSRTNTGPAEAGGFCPLCGTQGDAAHGDDGLGYMIGYRLTVPCTEGAVTTATRMDRHDRLFDRFEDEVEDLFAVGHSLITVEWDTVHGETEFSHFVLALREDRPRAAKVWRLSPP